jgi:hypothetical protein
VQLGAALVIPKPFQLGEVAQILAKLIGEPLPTSVNPLP